MSDYAELIERLRAAARELCDPGGSTSSMGDPVAALLEAADMIERWGGKASGPNRKSHQFLRDASASPDSPWCHDCGFGPEHELHIAPVPIEDHRGGEAEG